MLKMAASGFSYGNMMLQRFRNIAFRTNQNITKVGMSSFETINVEHFVSNSNITPVNFFKNKTYAQIDELFITK